MDRRRDAAATRAFAFEMSQVEGSPGVLEALLGELAAQFVARCPCARFTCAPLRSSLL